MMLSRIFNNNSSQSQSSIRGRHELLSSTDDETAELTVNPTNVVSVSNPQIVSNVVDSSTITPSLRASISGGSYAVRGGSNNNANGNFGTVNPSFIISTNNNNANAASSSENSGLPETESDSEEIIVNNNSSASDANNATNDTFADTDDTTDTTGETDIIIDLTSNTNGIHGSSSVGGIQIPVFGNEIQSEIQALTEQRDQYKSNTNSWTIIFTVLLLKLMMESMFSADAGLLFLSLMCTSYLWRWKRWRAMQLQRFDEQIENLSQLSHFNHRVNGSASARAYTSGNEDEEVGLNRGNRRRINLQLQRINQQMFRMNQDSNGSGTYDGEDASGRMSRSQRERRLREFQMTLSNRDHGDVEMWSFHAQLAIALMESQRLAQGRGEASQNQTRGVSDENKQEWQTFEYSDENCFYNQIQSSQNKDLKRHSEDDDPTCCICLCEYEKGDKLVKLQCGHAYHSDCIDSWCSNHVRCPLCNFDLGQNNISSLESNESNELDSIV